jgi:hypothetical protein
MPFVVRAPQRDLTDMLLAVLVSFAVFFALALFVLSTTNS